MHRWIAVLLVGLALAVWASLRWQGAGTEGVAATAAAPAVSATPESPATDAAVHPPRPVDPPVAAAPDPEAHRARVLRDPELEDRARQHELAPAADARWHEAVDGAGYRPEDFDPAVRDLFQRIDLEPRYAEGGRIEGLTIRSLAMDHPLARAGFQPGDRIDRIQGVPLRDPADLPSILARLGPNFELCADRSGASLCRDLELALE